MADRFTLAQKFVETDPLAAARALEEMAPKSASKFIDAVADPQSASLLASMMPYHAAKCVANLSAPAAARYLAGVEAREMAKILRFLGPDERAGVVKALPPHLAARVSLLLHYSPSVVGAWLNPGVLTLPPDCTVADAKARIANADVPDCDRIYAVDAKQSLAGAVKLAALIRAADDTPLTKLLKPVAGSLSAQESLLTALDSPLWLETDFLAVLDRLGRFIGIVRFAELRKAAQGQRSQTEVKDISGSLMDLAEYCYLGLADVVGSSLAAAPRNERARRR